MQIGVVENNLAGQTLNERLKHARRIGFESVELLCAPDNEGKENLRHYREHSLDEIRDKFSRDLEEFNTVSAHAYFKNIHDPVWNVPHPKCADIYLSEIEWSMRVGKELGAKVVTFHPGWLAYGSTEEAQKQSMENAFWKLDRIALDMEMQLGVEVIDFFMPLERFEFLRELKLKKIGITLDTGHAVFCGKMGISTYDFDYPAYQAYGSLAGFVREFGDLIVDVHIHDCDGKHDHLTLGQGTIDFKELADALKEVGYGGPLNIETDVSTPELARKNISVLKSSFGL